MVFTVIIEVLAAAAVAVLARKSDLALCGVARISSSTSVSWDLSLFVVRRFCGGDIVVMTTKAQWTFSSDVYKYV